MSTILREELVEYSVLQYLREELPEYGFVLEPEEGATVRIREAFPTHDERAKELDMTTVAFGFNIDDGGRQAELGSNLTEYTHTLMVWVFGLEPRFARRLAFAVKHVVRKNEDVVPLRDYNLEEDPVIDSLTVLKSQVQHQANSSPRPWDRFVWTCAINVRDYAYP